MDETWACWALSALKKTSANSTLHGLDGCHFFNPPLRCRAAARPYVRYWMNNISKKADSDGLTLDADLLQLMPSSPT
jgi:hypothetical protein